MISIQQACAEYLAEQEESVGQEPFSRIASICTALLQHLEGYGLTDAAAVQLDQVTAFVYSSDAKSSDVFFTVKSFVKWLGRRKYARKLSEEFAECEAVLREELKARAAKR